MVVPVTRNNYYSQCPLTNVDKKAKQLLFVVLYYYLFHSEQQISASITRDELNCPFFDAYEQV